MPAGPNIFTEKGSHIIVTDLTQMDALRDKIAELEEDNLHLIELVRFQEQTIKYGCATISRLTTEREAAIKWGIALFDAGYQEWQENKR